MYNFNVRSRYLTIPTNYPDRNYPDLMHYELRKFDQVAMRDNRISDVKFEDVTYPCTHVVASANVYLPFFVDRSKKNKNEWVVCDRNTKHVIARFTNLPDAEAFRDQKSTKAKSGISLENMWPN